MSFAGTRKSGEYKVFEMTSQSLSEDRSQETPGLGGYSSHETDEKSGRASRARSILNICARLVVVGLLITVFVLYFQLQSKRTTDSQEFQKEVQYLKQVDSNYSKALLKETEDRRKVDSDQKSEANVLDAQIQHVPDLLKDSKELEKDVEYLKQANSIHSVALSKEIEDRKKEDFAQQHMIHEGLQENKQQILNQSIIFNGRLEESEQSGMDQIQEVKERLAELGSAYLNVSKAMSEDIEELKEANSNYMAALQTEIEERGSADFNNSRMLQEKVEELRQIDVKLTDDIHTLKLADNNQSEALKSAMRRNNEQNQQRFTTLSDKINKTKTAYERKFKKISATFEELQQTDSNQSMRLKIAIDELKKTDANSSASLISRLQQLKDDNANYAAALKRETKERKQTDSLQENQFEDGFNQLNSSQSHISMQIENMLSRIIENEAQSGTIETVKSKIDELNRTITLLATGWKGDPKVILYKKFNDKVNYRLAASRCQSVGGRLAAKALRDANTARLLKTTGYITAHYWIGYDDIAAENTWIWSDGSTSKSQVLKWYNGKPDNYGNNEDCGIVLTSGGTLYLGDVDCTTNIPYLCERDPLVSAY